MTVRYGVKVAHWDLALGAEHYYATIWRYDPDPPEGEEGIEREDVRFELSAAAAARLNRKDADGILGQWEAFYKPGDTTNRFDTPGEALEAGIAALRRKYGDGIRIEKGDFHRDNSIVWPRAEEGELRHARG